MGGMTDCRGFTTGRGLSPWQVSLLSESQTFMSQSTLYKSGLRASVLTIRLNAIKDIMNEANFFH